MKNIKDLGIDILTNGTPRQTRTGDVISVWDRKLQWDMDDGFPVVTSKTLAWKSVVGELLWFLSGSETISDLRVYTFGEDKGQWTIWSDDAARWSPEAPDRVGKLYPAQWRNYNGKNIDQINNLVNGLIRSPYERNHIVMAWNPEAISFDMMALKPCHMGFQCYVTNDGRLNLKWFQRSSDFLLGLPYNTASYALLLHMISSWTGLKPGILSCDMGDCHIYANHVEQVKQYIANKEFSLPKLVLPDDARRGLDMVTRLTALDFADALVGYESAGKIKAPLSVGI